VHVLYFHFPVYLDILRQVQFFLQTSYKLL
jgi:hypothetical protein